MIVKGGRRNEDDPLVAAAANRALSYLKRGGRRQVAVIVNRVRTADEIARALRLGVKEDADVVLLTGRIRPFERDRTVERWKPFLKAASPHEPERPVLLVSTQCIEVGADFSFDALVTECASLDALRQRFGRLNRMGLPGAAPATILIREEDSKSDEPDPIYGMAIQETWRLLNESVASQEPDLPGRTRPCLLWRGRDRSEVCRDGSKILPNELAVVSRTVWMANLLAYRALALFPSAPASKGLNTTGWSLIADAPRFTWPIWEHPADADTIRSLLQLRELSAPNPDRSVLRARGIVDAFRARRIEVGNRPLQKINFSPARSV